MLFQHGLVQERVVLAVDFIKVGDEKTLLKWGEKKERKEVLYSGRSQHADLVITIANRKKAFNPFTGFPYKHYVETKRKKPMPASIEVFLKRHEINFSLILKYSSGHLRLILKRKTGFREGTIATQNIPA